MTTYALYRVELLQALTAGAAKENAEGPSVGMAAWSERRKRLRRRMRSNGEAQNAQIDATTASRPSRRRIVLGIEGERLLGEWCPVAVPITITRPSSGGGSRAGRSYTRTVVLCVHLCGLCG